MKKVTGTLIWYYYICKREVWLMSREINPFQDNAFLELGRLVSQDTYSRDKKEIEIEGGKIDMIRKRDGSIIVGEIKKSSKFIEPAKMQLVYYLYLLKKQGINAAGELLIPKEKKRLSLTLSSEMENKLENAIQEIREIMEMDVPPPLVKNKYCRTCAYYEFCFS